MEKYPKPGPVGGKLIRQVLSMLRSADFTSPLDSHILCACSGGADSVALAHLMQKYGRKITSRERLRIIHVNHGWRGEDSDQDARWVEELGRSWGIPVDVFTARGDEIQAGRSVEEAGRQLRKAAFAEAILKFPGVIFTAHHADDLAETALWRLLTGNSRHQPEGIRFISKSELRPFLQVRRHHLREYLGEEGLSWREDATNAEGRFLRSQMRSKLMPEVERIFPRGVDHLVRMALAEQGLLGQESKQASSEEVAGQAALFRAAGVRARRVQWETLQEKSSSQDWTGSLQLPGGWSIRKERGVGGQAERWVLEKS